MVEVTFRGSAKHNILREEPIRDLGSIHWSLNYTNRDISTSPFISVEAELCSVEFKWAECPNIQPIFSPERSLTKVVQPG
jgi:hypothetical protein